MARESGQNRMRECVRNLRESVRHLEIHDQDYGRRGGDIQSVAHPKDRDANVPRSWLPGDTRRT